MTFKVLHNPVATNHSSFLILALFLYAPTRLPIQCLQPHVGTIYVWKADKVYDNKWQNQYQTNNIHICEKVFLPMKVQ